MSNPFDQFDAPVADANPFDQFDGPNYKPPGGFAASAKQAVGSTIKGIGQAAEDVLPASIGKDNAIKRYGQSVIDKNPTVINEASDVADSPWMAAKEAVGNAAGSMGAMLGARALGMGISAAAPLTGPFAPATLLAGQAISNVGPFIAASAPSFGGIREKQIAKDPNSESSTQDKAVAALGAGTVGLIEGKFGPQALALKAMTKAGRDAIGKTFAETTLAKGIGYGALKGAATEGTEELVQNPIEQVAAYDDPRTPENIKDTLFSGAMGAIGGGVLGGGMGMVNQAMAKRPSQPGQLPSNDQSSIAPNPQQASTAAPQPEQVPPEAPAAPVHLPANPGWIDELWNASEKQQQDADYYQRDLPERVSAIEGYMQSADGWQKDRQGYDTFSEESAAKAEAIDTAWATLSAPEGGATAQQRAEAVGQINDALDDELSDFTSRPAGATPEAGIPAAGTLQPAKPFESMGMFPAAAPSPEQSAEQDILARTGGNPGPLASAAIGALRAGITPISQPVPTMSAFEQREADRPSTLDGDIATTAAGAPLTNRIMAISAARSKAMETGQSWQPIELGSKRFVIRPAPQVESERQPATLNTAVEIAQTATQPGASADIVNPNGKPFSSEFAAKVNAVKAGPGYQAVQIGEKAFVARKVAAPQAQLSYPQDTIQQPQANQPSTQPGQPATTPILNEQSAVQATNPEATQTPGEAPKALAGTAAATEGIPAAGGSPNVEGRGVAPQQAIGRIVRQVEPVQNKQIGSTLAVSQSPLAEDQNAAQAQSATPARAPKPAAGAPVDPKKIPLKQRIEQERQARADYFTPGNIVQGYSGHDRVISYQAPDAKGNGWHVTVQAVVKQDGQWVPDPKDSRVRTHSTHPTQKELVSGPVLQVQAPATPEKAGPAAAISDVGEKIGGARKDTATSTRRKAPGQKAETDDRETWEKRFSISQVTAGFDINVKGQDIGGKWTISDNREKRSFGGSRVLGGYFNSKEEAEAALPLIAVALKHSVTTAREYDANGNLPYEIWRKISDSKRVKVVDKQFATRNEAMEYMSKHAREILETNTTFGEADLPKPESTIRTGVERRTGDIEGKDFIEAFGMRGVEFGNWNNQTERQEVMNAAYDGLMDLADVLGVPPKAIGLNGDLALAFGARGQGLSSARAHYEHSRVVMNLTKMNGAGALAHEWFHALDHYLGRQDGKASSEWKINPDGTRSLETKGAEADMASSGFRSQTSGVREELRAAYKTLIQTLFYKAEQYVEDTAKADKFVGVTRGELEKELQTLRKELSSERTWGKRNNKPASAEQLAEFDAVAAALVEGRGLETEWKTMPGNGASTKLRPSIISRHTNESLEKISELYKAVRGRSGFNSERTGVADSLRGYISRYDQRLKMLAAANNSETKTKNVPTNFAMDAKSLDQGRGGDYWTSPHEMAARAFQGYVEDMISAKDGKSPFLNHAPENAGILTPWGAKRPYPSGDERKAMNKAFDAFVQKVQTKETDKGVAMFSSKPFFPRSMRSVVRANPQSIQKFVDGVAKVAKTVLPINVVANPGVVINAEGVNLASILGVNAADTGGAVVDGQIYLFSDNLRSMGDVKVTLFHELFHFGLRKVIPSADYVALMRELGKSSTIAKLADKWKASAIGKAEQSRHPTSVYNAIAIEEALAETEENLLSNSNIGTSKPLLIRQLLAWFSKVADWLGFDGMAQAMRRMTMTDAEKFVNQMVRAALGGNQNLVATQNRIADGVFSVSDPKDAASTINAGLSAATVTDLKHKFGNRLADFRGLALQTLGRRQLVDIYAKDIPMLDAYSNMVAQMDADKNEAGADADKLVTDWAKLNDERQLAELMHDATRGQIDPSKPFVEGDDQNFYDALRDGYDRLSPEAKAVYARAREMYTAHHEKVRAGIKERIDNSALSSTKRQALLEKMDGELFKKTKGVYFPLSRFGQYLTIVKDETGEVRNVTRSETLNEAEETRRLLKRTYPAAGGFQVGKVLRAREFNAVRDGVGRGFMEDLFQTLEKTGASEELQDSISQLYLASLPDLSWSKHGIHRKGTPGFSQDARRAFAANMFHGGNYLAKLRFSDRLQSSLDDMQEHVDGQKDNETYDSVKAQQVVDEMVKRHESLMNPKSNPIATALTSFGFVFHLGLSPASALVNLSQTAMVAYPIMGAKWGFEKSATALLSASKQAASNKNDISKVLKGDELGAYNEAVRSGVIDVTMAHDLAGISQGEDANLSAKIRPVMKWASFMFHHAEKFNRQVTFVASYRLAREGGAGHQEAYADAVKATYDGHFDYSASNRARVMQGNWPKVILLFKQYAQNMIYVLSRNLQQAIAAETPQDRAQARKAISGLLVSHALGAGAFGLPLVGTLLGVASMIGGDDDEPWDAQVALQNMLADTFGQQAAEVFAHGLSRLTPWDISGRVGLDRLLLPDVQEGLQGADAVNAWMASALGPVAGIAVNVGRGMQEMADGRYLKGLESMMPSALRGPLKAYRYETEGNVDKTGIVINDEVGAAGVAGQFLGFSPSETRLAQEGKSAIYASDRAIQSRRSDLVRQFALAAMAQDEEGKAEARASIARFNEKNPSAWITPAQLMRSVMTRHKRIADAQQGVYLPRKRQGAMEAGRFALTD